MQHDAEQNPADDSREDRIAEIPPDDDTSWVASATPGDRDLYAMAPLGMTPLAIKGLQQTALARKDDAGDRAISLILKSGTEVVVVPATILGSSYTFIEHIHETEASRVFRRQLHLGHAAISRFAMAAW